MNRIREIRKLMGVTQTALARAANISNPFLHDLELGARGAKPETLERIAEALGVTVEQLKGKEEAN